MNKLIGILMSLAGTAMVTSSAHAAGTEGPHTKYPAKTADNVEEVWKNIKPGEAGKWTDDFVNTLTPYKKDKKKADNDNNKKDTNDAPKKAKKKSKSE